MVKILSDILDYFCTTTELCNFWPQHISFFDCLTILLRCTKPMNSRLIFDIQCLCKLKDLFSCTRVFSRHRWVRCHRTFISPSFSCWENFCFDHFLVLVFIIAFTCGFYNFLVFPRHPCLYSSLLLNDWSTPMTTMCFPSCLYFNNPLIITHCCLNELISNISFVTLINSLDLAHFSAWVIFPSIWKHIYYFLSRVSLDDRGVVVADIVSPKEGKRTFFEVSHMNVNRSYLFRMYYHCGWCFDIIHIMLHNFHTWRYLKHCCVGFV